jgi:hypothetical protein
VGGGQAKSDVPLELLNGPPSAQGLAAAEGMRFGGPFVRSAGVGRIPVAPA